MVGGEMSDLMIGLQGFGLTEYESKIYIALLEGGLSTVNQLQYSSGVPRTKVYSVTLQLAKKGVVKVVEGRPVRFQAQSPEVFQSAILDGEKRVKVQKRILGSLKKMVEKNIMPHDVVEERYVSLGSQSVLMKLKDSVLKAQSSVRCIVDGWGLHLVQECAEELETISRQDIEVMILSAIPPAPVEFQFSSPRMVVRYGRHLPGKNVFIFDNAEVMIVNSQTGRGYVLLLNELRDIIGDTIFSDYWKSSTSRKTLAAVSSLAEEAPALLDSAGIAKLFTESVSRAVTNEKLQGSIGSEFLALAQEKMARLFTGASFENSVKLIIALMAEEIGEGASAEFDPLTRILRIEIPDTQGRTPASVWYFALAGLLARTGAPYEILQNTSFPEAKSRIIQTKILPPK